VDAFLTGATEGKIMQRFENKTILITGSSSGIGLAGARRLVEEGARVIITGRTEERLQAAAAELGDNAIAVLDNVSDGKTLERLIPVVEKVGSLDGLWLNAAYAVGAPLEETDKATIEDMFQVNVVAPMLQMGALSPFLNTGASVLALRDIRVNTLVPGPITSNLRSVLPDELRSQFEEKLADVVLLKRVGDAKEAAAVALFLLSDDASYVTGSSYVVDGGLLMS